MYASLGELQAVEEGLLILNKGKKSLQSSKQRIPR
jgi:hypothetical protein